MKENEKKIFDYLTAPENFSTMVGVADRFKIIRKELLTQFWSMTKEHLEKLNNSKGGKWIVDYDFTKDIFEPFSKGFSFSRKYIF